MSKRFLRFAAGVLLGCSLAGTVSRWAPGAASFVPGNDSPALAFTGIPLTHAADSWPEIRWEDLIPRGWDPAADLRKLDLSKLQDSDPRAIEALEKIRSLSDNAPTEPSLNGRRGRIAGFALPLERQGDQVSEFLLVPYFGACIHVPPPPANQIIHARSAKPLTGVGMMAPIWAYGTIRAQRNATTWGIAGYQLTVDKVAPYEIPAKR